MLDLGLSHVDKRGDIVSGEPERTVQKEQLREILLLLNKKKLTIFNTATYSNPTSPARVPSNNLGRLIKGSAFDISLFFPPLGSLNKSFFNAVDVLEELLGANPRAGLRKRRGKAAAENFMVVMGDE